MAWDPVWEEVHRSRAWGKYPPEDLVRWVARNFYSAADRRSVRLLEVGCGTGANLWFMAREGFRVDGIDGSETAVRASRERLDLECPNWSSEVRTGDMMRLPYPDALFDGAIDVEAIAYNSFDHACAVYAEMARVCKSGALLFSKTFAEGCWGEGTGGQVGRGMWQVAVGPLAGIGATRFTTIREVPELVRPFRVASVEVLTRTLDNRQHKIRELIIQGSKP
jgi:SAM-dependent methyltransferase